MELQEEMEQLKKQLATREEDLNLAAKYGQELLENNFALSEKIDELTKQYSLKIQDLEQENYSLTMKMEVKVQIEKTQSAELEFLEKKIADLVEEVRTQETTEAQKMKNVDSLQQEINELGEENTKLSLECNILKDKLTLMESHVQEMKVEITNSTNKTDKNPTEELQTSYNELILEKQSLEKDLNDATDQVKKLKVEVEHLSASKSQCEKYLEEKEHQIAANITALEKLRQEKLEMQVEMDASKINDFKQDQRGNSLFAEVEDKRIQLQNQLISIRVSHDALKRRNEVYKQQASKMKHQMVCLLSMSSHKVDADRMQQLQISLDQSQAEVQDLTAKLANVRNEETDCKPSFPREAYVPKECEDEASYTEFLLSESRKEIEDLKKKLESSRFQKVAEADIRFKCEQKLYSTEKTCDAYKTEIMKLKLQIDELKFGTKAPEKAAVSGMKEKLPGFNSEVEQTSKSSSNDSHLSKELSLIEKNLMQKKLLKLSLDEIKSDKQIKKSVRLSDDAINSSQDQKESAQKENRKPKLKGKLSKIRPVHISEAVMELPQ